MAYTHVVRTYFDPNNMVQSEQTTLQSMLDGQETKGLTTPTIRPDTFQTNESGEPFIERFFYSLEAAKEYRAHCAGHCTNYIRSVIRPATSYDGAIFHAAGEPLN